MKYSLIYLLTYIFDHRDLFVHITSYTMATSSLHWIGAKYTPRPLCRPEGWVSRLIQGREAPRYP